MNPLRIKQLLLLRPGQLVCMGLVLLFNHGYKTAIQFESCKNYLRYYIAPLHMQPVQVKQLPEINLKSVNLKGMPFPVSWSPRAISTRPSHVEYEVDISQKRILKIFVNQAMIVDGESDLFSAEKGHL